MPNTRGGKGYKKGKSGRVRERPEKKIEVVDVSAGEGFFAKVEKKLGGKPAQIEVMLNNGTKSIAFVRGKMHKKVWINAGMIVLVNKDMEIVKVIRDTDKDSIQANELLDKVGTNNVNYIDIYDDSDSSDSDSEEDLDSEEKKNDKEDSDDSLVNPNHCDNDDSDSEDSLVNPNHCENYEEEEEEEEDEQEETYKNYNKKNNKNNKKGKINIDDI